MLHKNCYFLPVLVVNPCHCGSHYFAFITTDRFNGYCSTNDVLRGVSPQVGSPEAVKVKIFFLDLVPLCEKVYQMC